MTGLWWIVWMSPTGSSRLRSFRLPIVPYNKSRCRLSKEALTGKTISKPPLKSEDLHGVHLISPGGCHVARKVNPSLAWIVAGWASRNLIGRQAIPALSFPPAPEIRLCTWSSHKAINTPSDICLLQKHLISEWKPRESQRSLHGRVRNHVRSAGDGGKRFARNPSSNGNDWVHIV